MLFNKFSLFEAGVSAYEFVLALCIIAILASIAVPAVNDHNRLNQVEIARKDIVSIARQIDHFYEKHQHYPQSLGELNIRIKDPWGNPYQYINLSQTHSVRDSMRLDSRRRPVNSDYELFSLGADGRTQNLIQDLTSRDDIIRANNGKFMDLAEKY